MFAIKEEPEFDFTVLEEDRQENAHSSEFKPVQVPFIHCYKCPNELLEEVIQNQSTLTFNIRLLLWVSVIGMTSLFFLICCILIWL